ncbi:hypothetical protein THICB3560244 [Thiomonas sp. CB3]|nr:hypothetical protein THICB3560244 [Thiomonas sp. CB3]
MTTINFHKMTYVRFYVYFYKYLPRRKK